MPIGDRVLRGEEVLDADGLAVAPGSVVVVRDEEWLVTGVERTRDGALLSVKGLTELVRDTDAMFYEGLDRIKVLDPAEATVVGDPSPGNRRARLWLEATLPRARCRSTTPRSPSRRSLWPTL